MKAVTSSVYQSKEGQWIASYRLEGKKKRVCGRTKDEAVSKRDNVVEEINQDIGNPQPFLFEGRVDFEVENHSFDFKAQAVSNHEVVLVNANEPTPSMDIHFAYTRANALTIWSRA